MVYMLSRIADSMFWLNRYMERTDGLIRTLRTFYILSFDKELRDQQGYRPVLQCFTSLGEEEMTAMQNNTQAVLKYLITDTKNINSVKVMVNKARENARGTQDKITKELWEQINYMYHMCNSTGLADMLCGNDALVALDRLHRQCLLYTGIIDSTMPRGQGWSFMNTGKFIERCLHTVEMLETYFEPLEFNLDGPEDMLYWRRLLLSLSGYELYLKDNRSTQHNFQVVEQVGFNPDFPRSLLYCLERIDRYLEDVIRDNNVPGVIALHKQFGRLKSKVQFTDVDELTGEQLKALLQEVRQLILEFSGKLGQLFFSYS